MDNTQALISQEEVTQVLKSLFETFQAVEQARSEATQKLGDVTAAMRYLETVSGASPKHLKAFIVQHPEYVTLLQDPNVSAVTTITGMASELWEFFLQDNKPLLDLVEQALNDFTKGKI